MWKRMAYLLFLFPCLAFSHEASEAKGAQLAQQFWTNVQHKRMKKIESTLSRDFQAFTTTGAITRKRELYFLSILPISQFSISNVRTTKDHHRLVVTYDLDILDGTTHSFFHQLFVWIEREGKWQLTADTFIPFTPS